MVEKKVLYHIHRTGFMDPLWHIGNTVQIDSNFKGFFYTQILKEEEILIKRYGKNYDIDYLIKIMKKMKSDHILDTNTDNKMDEILNHFYFIRRERALEDGRLLFAPDSPSRLHSLFFTDKQNLSYWIACIKTDNSKIFLLDLEGTFFESSDKYFPNPLLNLSAQVEQSKAYWKPERKKLTLHKEFLFQGKGRILS